MEIGAQFYTVRDFCKTLDDFAESLKKVADIGYRNVQISGTCPYDAQWLKEQLDRNGLRCVLTHIPAPRLTGETEQVVRDHEIFGCDHIGLGYYSFDPERGDTYEKFVETYGPVAKKISSMGKTFMYHNHDGEFRRLEDGRIVMAHLMEDFPADQLGFTLDTTNFKDQLSNCVSIYERYKGELLSGTHPTDEVVPQIMNEMRAAGFDDIVAQCQEQVDAFMASNGGATAESAE